MSFIHATPQEIETFAGVLTSFNSQLRDSTSWLRGQVNHLGTTWDDPKFYEFSEDLEQTTRVLYQFMERAEEYVGYLNRQAHIGYDWLNNR